MAFHISNLGAFGGGIPHDMNGYVPEAAAGPWDFQVDHGTESTHDASGELTEYGEWWESEGFPEWRSRAVESTKESIESLSDWQAAN